MNIQAEKSSWLEGIAKGDQQQAIEDILLLLRTWVDRSNRTEAREYLKQFTILSGRWNDLRKEAALGIISTAEEKLEGNKLTHALLTFLDQLPDELNMERESPSSDQPSGISNRRPILIAGGMLLFALVGIFLFSQINSPDGTIVDDQSNPPVGASDSSLEAVDTVPLPEHIDSTEAIVDERERVDLWQLKYELPSPLPIDWNLTTNMCESTYGCLPAQFLPIGWSADDRFFAYITLPAKEAVEGVTLIIKIQNMVDNTIFWEYTYGKGESSRRNKYKTVEAIWSGLYDQFTGKLRTRGIIPGAGRMVIFPGKINGKDIDIRLATTMHTGGRGREVIHTETVSAALSGQDFENIYSHTYPKYGPLNTVIIGALVSPSSRTAALIKVNEYLGYEGPPNPLSPTVIGWKLQ